MSLCRALPQTIRECVEADAIRQLHDLGWSRLKIQIALKISRTTYYRRLAEAEERPEDDED